MSYGSCLLQGLSLPLRLRHRFSPSLKLFFQRGLCFGLGLNCCFGLFPRLGLFLELFLGLSCGRGIRFDLLIRGSIGRRESLRCFGLDSLAFGSLGQESLIEPGPCFGLGSSPLLGRKPGRRLGLGLRLSYGSCLLQGLSLPLRLRHRFSPSLKLFFQRGLCFGLGLNCCFGLFPRLGLFLELFLGLSCGRGIRFDLLIRGSIGRRESLRCFGLDSLAFGSLGQESLIEPGSCFGFLGGPLLSLQPGGDFRFNSCFGLGSFLGQNLSLLLSLRPAFRLGFQPLLQFRSRLSLCLSLRLGLCRLLGLRLQLLVSFSEGRGM